MKPVQHCTNDIATIQELNDHQYKSMSLENLKELLNSDTVSKNQKKKIIKQIGWIESADLRKEKRKKRKLRYKEMRLKNKEQGYPAKRFKAVKISTVENFESNYHVAIDVSFDDLMTNKDVGKLGKQIGWCYKVNRRSSMPVQLHVCGLEGRLKTALDPSHENWDLHFNDKLFDCPFSDKLVYLTAESTNTLKEIDPGKVYVIGGLVDHNHHKGVCHARAEDKGVTTARLPLQENIDIKTRRVLTVNHVFEILSIYIVKQNWKEAILEVLPAKKIHSETNHLSNSSDEDESTRNPSLDFSNENKSLTSSLSKASSDLNKNLSENFENPSAFQPTAGSLHS